MKKLKYLTLLFALSGPFQQALAEPIGINFGSGRANAALLPADSAGAIPQTNWNNADGASGGPLALNDSDGIATSASLTWATDEQWSAGGPAADANGTLLNGWVSANNTTDPAASIAITGIPFENYNIYVYLNHDRATEDVLISEATSLFAPILAHENDTDILAPVIFTEQTTTADGDITQVGNYVVLPGLNQSDIEIILEPGGNAGSVDRGAITGIQIIEVLIGDSDGDGLDDTWESSFGLDPNDNGLNPNNNGVAGNPDNGADGDPDNDGLTNAEEQARGTFPNDEDTDNDTLLDGVETNDGIYVDETMTGTNPLSVDSDGDNLRDNVETNTGTFVDATNTGTDPNANDTDSDTLLDDWEVLNNLDPSDDGTANQDNGANGDPDGDSSTNADEQSLGTDPNDDDSDDDNLLDGVESNTGTYIDATDTGTDPLNADTDNDGLQDDIENNSGSFVSATEPGTDPNTPDTDGDIFGDGWEALNGRNPIDPTDNLAEAGAIGLNFGAGRANASLLATDIAGIAPQGNWNNLSFATGTEVLLNDDQGSDSGATVNWALDEEWSAAGPGADANGILLTGWISANGAGATNSIDISNIPFGSYDLIFYLNHDRATEDVLLSENNGAFESFLAHENDTDVLNPINFVQQAASATDDGAQVGNFVAIPNLNSETLNLVLGAGGDWGSTNRGAITGIQIINRGASEGLKITSITPDEEAGTVTITWNSVSGRVYAIDAGDSPALSEANEINDFTATGEISSFTESFIDFSANPKRFYRVRELNQ